MEQIIVFVYDTECCQTEADDPQRAVLYFYPCWVSDQQRLALCGQLIGASQFCFSLFSSPSIISLQSGKFLLRRFGRYIISVGSDQSLPDWILNDRFRILNKLLEFYHKDFGKIFHSVDSDYDRFGEVLSGIFEGFIPVLQAAVSSVGCVPTVHYSKAGKTVFLEAVELLDTCCAKNNVFGGNVLHNGRVIASQLDSTLTKILVLTDPHRVKNSAEPLSIPFRLPVGVQIFRIHPKNKLLESLKSKFKNSEGKRLFTRAHITTVPEDETWQPRDSVKRKSRNRRNSKKNDLSALKERSRKFKSNSNITVCSTPTIEKKSIHDELLSICNGKIEPTKPTIPDLVQDVINKKSSQDIKLNRLCMDDQMIDFSHSAFPIPLRYYSFGLPKIYTLNDEKPKKLEKKYKTVADPMCPVFKHDGSAISRFLYKQCLDEHYKNLMVANRTIDSREEFIRSKNLENILNKPINNDEPVTKVVKQEKKIDQKVFRRSLTLPLKPMILDEPPKEEPPEWRKSKLPPCVTPSTPLMTKLGLLALEEQNIQEIKEKTTKTRLIYERKSKPEEAAIKLDETGETTECCLFVCGHKTMSLHLIVAVSVAEDPELILSLWETATCYMDRIEAAWQRSAEQLSEPNSGNNYSFVSLDTSRENTLKKHGPWPSDDSKVVASLRQQLLKDSSITEIIVRNEDSVVYGYRCGDIETYYQQSSCSFIGLPTPADLMGVVTLKARRRLERDYNILML